MSTHTSSWYASAQGHRPQGTSGTYAGEYAARKFPAVIDRDGLVWYETALKTWVPMRGWDAARFTPDEDVLPEWAEQCNHPTLCYSERDCDRLHFEQGDGSW